MFRKIVASLFIILFMAFISAPSIIVALDDSIDVSIVFSTSEEEEKGNEKHVDVEVLFLNLKTNESDFVFNSTENNLGYYFKKYLKPHLNLISPPPEFI